MNVLLITSMGLGKTFPQSGISTVPSCTLLRRTQTGTRAGPDFGREQAHNTLRHDQCTRLRGDRRKDIHTRAATSVPATNTMSRKLQATVTLCVCANRRHGNHSTEAKMSPGPVQTLIWPFMLYNFYHPRHSSHSFREDTRGRLGPPAAWSAGD